MGVLYFIGCKNCKKYRDLDKLQAISFNAIKDKKDAINFSEKIEKDSYRIGLLVSFMADHIGHNCFLFTDNDTLFEFKNAGAIEEDKRFW